MKIINGFIRLEQEKLKVTRNKEIFFGGKEVDLHDIRSIGVPVQQGVVIIFMKKIIKK